MIGWLEFTILELVSDEYIKLDPIEIADSIISKKKAQKGNATHIVPPFT